MQEHPEIRGALLFFHDAKLSGKDVAAGLKKGASDVQSHFKVKEGRQERAKRKSQQHAKEEAAKELSTQAQATAAEASERLKAAMVGNAVGFAVFKVATKEFAAVRSINADNFDRSGFPFQEPFVTTGTIDALAALVGHGKLQKKLQWFLGSCQDMAGWFDNRKVQYSMQKKKGLEE